MHKLLHKSTRRLVIPQPFDGQQEQQSIDDIKHTTARLVIATRMRHVNRFWLEKVVLVIEALQIYGLIWQLAQPWPWPVRWLRWTRWTNAFNLDYLSFTDTGAAMGATQQSFSLWGEMPLYWIYALVYAVIPHACLVFWYHQKAWWQETAHQDFLQRQVQLENSFLQWLQLLYLPIGLAVMRLINCDADGRVSIDPETFGGADGCWSWGHVLAVIVITCIVGGSFLVVFPWLLYRRISVFLVQTQAEQYERFLQSKELEFVLGTSSTYEELHMPLYASFRRHAVWWPVEMCVWKAASLLTFSVLRSRPPSKDNQGLQGTLVFLLLLWQVWRRSSKSVFRVYSSSQFAQVLAWLLVTNGIFVLLCANGVRSALTVSTSVNSCLTFLNGCCVIVLVLLLVATWQQWRQSLVPRINLSSKSSFMPGSWPVHMYMPEIQRFKPQLHTWIEAIQQAQRVLTKAFLAPSSMRPHRDLGLALQQLDLCHRESSAANHLLAPQLYETLLRVREAYIDAVATSPFHHVEPSSDLVSQLRSVLDRRQASQALLTTRNKRILAKINAMCTWQMPLATEDDAYVWTPVNAVILMRTRTHTPATERRLLIDAMDPIAQCVRGTYEDATEDIVTLSFTDLSDASLVSCDQKALQALLQTYMEPPSMTMDPTFAAIVESL